MAIIRQTLIGLLLLFGLTGCTTMQEAPQEPIEKTTTAYIANGKETICMERQVELPEGIYTVQRFYNEEPAELISCRFETTQVSAPYTVQTMEIEGHTASIRQYDREEAEWQEEPLRTGEYPKGMYFLTIEQKQLVICTPQVYEARGNGTREYLPKYDGSLQVQRTDTGYTISLHTPDLPNSVFADWLVMRSDIPFIDWTDESLCERWAGYYFMEDNRWCLDGYFYATPTDYYPTGPNYYRNMPAAYIASKMVRDEEVPSIFPLAMLSVMRSQWNAEGYVPTRAGSQWLRNDYGIAPGYYDTRFNTELAAAELDAIERYQVEGWMDDILNYVDYFCYFAQQNHFDVTNMQSVTEDNIPVTPSIGHAGPVAEREVAWLVQDYSHPAGGMPTHCSLNHHVAETLLLYKVADVLGGEEYQALADIMLRGIENTESLWRMSDGNLHYAMLPDGTMGLQDYPYLTYNDLLALQEELIKRGNGANPAVARLLASKKGWMDRHYVRGYNEPVQDTKPENSTTETQKNTENTAPTTTENS